MAIDANPLRPRSHAGMARDDERVVPSDSGSDRVWLSRLARRGRRGTRDPALMMRSLVDRFGSRAGVVPSSLSERLGGDEQVFDLFDRIVDHVRPGPAAYASFPNKVPVTGKLLDAGQFGIVYEMNIQGERYALKVYKDQPDPKVKKAKNHGALGEAPTGLFFAGKTGVLTRFHFGAPQRVGRCIRY
jgi:hypothetical protein